MGQLHNETGTSWDAPSLSLPPMYKWIKQSSSLQLNHNLHTQSVKDLTEKYGEPSVSLSHPIVGQQSLEKCSAVHFRHEARREEKNGRSWLQPLSKLYHRWTQTARKFHHWLVQQKTTYPQTFSLHILTWRSNSSFLSCLSLCIRSFLTRTHDTLPEKWTQ